jgi:hypothetical protein
MKISPTPMLSKMTEEDRKIIFDDAFASPLPENIYGYVPYYPKPIFSDQHNPFDLIEGNENKLY